MTTAKIKRLAARTHRGQTFGRDGDFLAHLERAAAAVTGLTRNPAAAQAAWLYAAPDAGVVPADLHRLGIAPNTVRLVEALQRRPEELYVAPHNYAERLLRTPDAALVRYAVLTDLYRHRADESAYEDLRKEHIHLADALGLPRPSLNPKNPLAGQGLAALVDARPGVGGHWGPVARAMGELRDAAALPYLVEGYHAENVPDGRFCCLVAVQAAIHTIVTRPENASTAPVDALIEQWWDAENGWEQRVAVWGRAVARDRAHRDALLCKVAANEPGTVSSAIPGLVGPGCVREVALLRTVVERDDPRWRWARRAAVARLVEIGSPEAATVLRERPLDPTDPPWHADPTWLTAHGADVVDTLVAYLDEYAWVHEGPFALGELRAVEGVPALCAMLRSANPPFAAIDALGKIGSPDAVPTLLECLHHDRPEVRDLALRALSRISDPRVVAAAIEACDDPDPRVRERAVRVLARHGDERAVPQLIRACDTAYALVALRALVRLGDPRALPTLWHLFGDATADRAVRHTAGQGLAAIAGPQQYVHHTRDLRVRRAYVWLLGHKPEWKPEYQLKTATADDDAIMRARAAEAFGRLGDPAGAEHVRPLLDDPDPRVRDAAATALRRLA
ncbi:HEAT repeat domain-containing protein [Catellatospora tritici]|uniref:HEAT repeat domain-containing protein n=1 Tax=Catellatospora tritici TaxID=2851566 RepID=UPI001C2CD452|nr:HEAT repeat domain-containing protein [Catellatospora tritici]MBV1849270.1 HEAT repeat domain-containing protein [Catellatospora tritici]